MSSITKYQHTNNFSSPPFGGSQDAEALKAFSPAVSLQDLWLQDLLTDQQCVLTEICES